MITYSESLCRRGGLKLYLGCATPPFHEQHIKIMGNVNDWVWVDKFVKHPEVYNWDAEKLEEVLDGSVEAIYASHLLEHFEHPKLLSILRLWRDKLVDRGEIIINVPDMRWIAEQILRYENGQLIESNHYYEWEGEHGLQQVIFGSHAHPGEGHHAGFTKTSIKELFERAGFQDVIVDQMVDAHDMGVLILKANK